MGILHVHSMYSLHDSAQTPKEIVAKAKELGVKSIALTDHGTLLGIPSFMKAGAEYGINAVPGCEFYLEGMEHLVIVAKDYEGYVAISRALRDAWRSRIQSASKRWYPVLTEEVMRRHFEGNRHVFATTACIGGPIARILLTNFRLRKKMERSRLKAEEYRASFEEWQQWNAEYLACVEKIKELKAESAEYAPYLTRNYQKKLKDPGQITFGEDMELKQDDGMQLVEHAKKAVAEIKAEIDELSGRRKNAKAMADKRKARKERYESLVGGELEYVGETDLTRSAKAKLAVLSGIFPDFYVELQNHGMEEELAVMPRLAALAAELGIPVIAANDAHIPDPSEDAVRSRKILRFRYFQKAEPVTDADREMYIKSPEELFRALSNAVGEETAAKALENTSILEDCQVVFPKAGHYPAVKDGEAEFDRLIAEAKAQMQEKGAWDPAREQRLEHEVRIIKRMGYVDYHLIVRDFCNMARILGGVPKSEIANIPNDFSKAEDWCRKKGFSAGVGVGPGRGSAVGSEVCYLLGITNVDPVRYDLLFERFLNPERVSMPDIDTDIKTSLRPVIIQYVKWKFGENAVVSIATADTYAAKSALQTAARNIASELYDSDKELTKAERDERKRKFAKHGYRLSDLVTGDNLEGSETAILSACSTPEEERIYHDARLIEGRLAGTGMHAGGVVISDNKDICDYMPLHWVEEKQSWATQCDMLEVEEHGLLKMDVLGSATLDLISDCLQLIRQQHGLEIDVNALEEDPDVFREIYAKGRTNSVFQFESSGMKQMLKKFRPESIEDLILLNACFRPGPLQYLDSIIEVKNTGRRKESCLTKIPELQPILAHTYGYPIYQEQVMQIFQKLAGYSLGGADMVRRAMSKKKTEKLAVERKAFLYGDEAQGIRGCQANGIDVVLAGQVFDQLMDFAKYGFNRSHAAAYTIVSYQTAWLKYHYPKEFLCAMFGNEDISDYGRIMEECEALDVKVLPPDINRSSFDFTIEDGKIRFGFGGIRGIADRSAINRIAVGNSRRVQAYRSLSEFLAHTGSSLDKRLMEALIKSGCFDRFVADRKKAFDFYGNGNCTEKEEAYLRASAVKDVNYNMEQEEKYLGAGISEDPLDGYPDDLECGCVPMDALEDGNGSVYGYVTNAALTVSRNGREMLVLSIRGRRGKMDALFLGAAYQRFSGSYGRWQNAVVRVTGRISGERMFVESVSYMSKSGTRFYVRIDSEEKAKGFLAARRKHEGEPGLCRLVMDVSVGNSSGAYRAICPRLVETHVPESVVEEVGAMQYKFT
ncbi:DNA polymerase III, alpha subunit [Lachnospiraceae bacterium MD308]|nr:DNA polymerase III, alpha subunit [Lachnospiraceae bacterium MD308]